MFLQKEKGLSSVGSLQTISTPPARSTLQLGQRPAQIMIQQPAASAPGTPQQSPFLTPTPSFQRSSSISSMAAPSTPTGVSGAQKFVIVSQGTPVASSSVMKVMTPQNQGSASNVTSAAGGQKIVLIQGGATLKSEDVTAVAGNQSRPSLLSSSQTFIGSAVTTTSNSISGKETL
ncbi:hypothetical protein PoB_006804500 [Plakobranchus ocellatus]|uniref:Uncharacterized protein n=1 Tax=Plakobranchus ocellatus TaxID=259542 RepID=A0AAV4DBX2_9GAST|nr:hypothetical protein PoB_006804500 [Plakobranchus ocellatus]